MNIQLTNKNALVCGSTSGIGEATAIVLAEMGANVTLLSRNEKKLQAVKHRLPCTGTQQHTYRVADFFDPLAVESVVQDYLQEQPRIHILINNTGGPETGPLLTKTGEAMIKYLQQHLVNSHTLAQKLVPGMRAAGYGRIINVTSNAAKQPLPNLGLSNTVRGAVANWAKTLANELGEYGITVNNVLPGATKTKELDQIIEGKAKASGQTIQQTTEQLYKLCPARRFGEPQEIAWAIGFLASPQAAYINGTNMVVDGGKTLSL